MTAGRGWVAVGLGLAMASTGCVERLIHDFDEIADGDGGKATEGETDTEPGDTDQFPGDTTLEPEPEPDPDVECTIPQDCADDQTCYEGVCVGTGSVRVSLSWNVVTDLDLHVQLPNGTWISYQNPITNHGELDVDDCVAGACINPDGTHVENVFLNANAPRGVYGVQIINFDGLAGADYEVEVAGDASELFFGSLPAEGSAESPLHSFTW